MFLAQEVSVSDLALILLYLGAVAYLGWLGYRHTKTAADYMVAGRKVHPFIMAMSYGATFISTSAIVGFGGVAGQFGMSLLWLTFLNIFVGIFLAFVLLGGPARRLGHRLDAHTFPELLGRRFDSKAIQVFAGLIIFVFMPIYAAAVLIGGTEFLATAFNMNYAVALMIFAAITAVYVFFGGLKGVLYTDAFQGSIMVIGMLLLIIWAYSSVGGIVQGHKELAAMALQVGSMANIGHRGYTAMPAFGWGKAGYDMWWIVISTIVMGVGIGVLAQPQLVVRFLTVKSLRELNRALAIGGSFILLMTGVAFTVGAVSNTYFYNHEKFTATLIGPPDPVEAITKRIPGQNPLTLKCTLLHLDTDGDTSPDTHVIATTTTPAGTRPQAIVRKADGSAVLPVALSSGNRLEVQPHCNALMRSVVWDAQVGAWMLNTDSIIPTFISTAMPNWFKVIFLLTLLSAAMSTMSSQYHALGTAMGRDVFEQLARGRGRTTTQTIHVVRAGIIAGLILALVIGYYARGGYFIARATSIWFGLCASAFLPTFFGALFCKRMTKAASITSMIVGLLVTTFWLVFIKDAEAGSIGLVRLFTPANASGVHPNSILFNHPNWPNVDPLLIALPLSILTAMIVSLFTRPPAPEHLDACFGPGRSLLEQKSQSSLPTGR